MFVKDLKNDFYHVISGKQCLLLVNFDVDAICASKILQTLFKNDNMVYTLVPVQGIQDMVRAYQDNAEQVTFVIMINCGGTLDIVDVLQPSEDVTVFIIDSHRPYDLCNVYSENQIRILGEPGDDEEIPEYNDVYRDDSTDEEPEEFSDEDDDLSDQAKRRKLNEERILKKRNLRQWEEKRETILFNYTQYSYYGKSSAVMAFELCWQMSKDTLDILWWAIVGATEQYILSKIESNVNILETGKLQGHVSRLSHNVGGDTESQLSAIKVTYDKDLQLALYRHWTVEDSLKHSLTSAIALRLWSIKGEQKLKELFADMGLPLIQSKQRFNSMDLNLRLEFKEMLEKLASKYKVDSIIGASFTLQYGYRFKYCSTDVAYAMVALLESSTKDKSPKQCFLEASECLAHTKKNMLDNGIEKAKNLLVHIFKAAQSILEMKQVINAGSFLYVILPDLYQVQIFFHPHSLIMLAHFILRAYVETSKNKNAKNWPLVISATNNEDTVMSLIAGIPPVGEDQPRSLFGRAFEQAAINTNSSFEADYFDTTVAKLKIEDRPKFFDALAALLI